MHDEHSPSEGAAHQLADLLECTSDDIITALGGPWLQGRFDGDHHLPDAHLFAGRADPSVAILIDPATVPSTSAKPKVNGAGSPISSGASASQSPHSRWAPQSQTRTLSKQ